MKHVKYQESSFNKEKLIICLLQIMKNLLTNAFARQYLYIYISKYTHTCHVLKVCKYCILLIHDMCVYLDIYIYIYINISTCKTS